jgi:hypothetical protein
MAMHFFCSRDWFKGSPWLGLALGLALLGGCASAPTFGLKEEVMSPGADAIGADQAVSRDNSALAPMAESMTTSSPPRPPETDLGQPTPQLVKQASLGLLLTDVDGAVTQVQEIVKQAQGDLLNLQDYRSPEGTAHQITLTLRVPQAQLESVLEAIRPLGTVQQQSLTAEDVSSQLVDMTARLKNLRQSETALLKIMERSGEISHVLEVARELSTVRESIERLAAQQQNLQRQVAYSQINLTLQSPVATVPPLRPVRETLENTWQTATQSVQAFTVGGLKMGLWLLAYSPYLMLLAALIYGGYRWRWERTVSPAPAVGEDA